MSPKKPSGSLPDGPENAGTSENKITAHDANKGKTRLNKDGKKKPMKRLQISSMERFSEEFTKKEEEAKKVKSAAPSKGSPTIAKRNSGQFQEKGPASQ